MKIGRAISKGLKIITLPIDIAESAMDVLCGGDGSKESKGDNPTFIGSSLRDGICNGIEELDE